MPGNKRSSLAILAEETAEVLKDQPPKKQRKKLLPIIPTLKRIENADYKLVTSKVIPRTNNHKHPSTLNMTICSREWKDDFPKIWDSLVNNAMLKTMTDACNITLRKLKSKKSSSYKKHFKPARRCDIKRFWEIYFLMEQEVRPEGNLKNRFDELRKLNIVPMSRNRYTALTSALGLKDSPLKGFCAKMDDQAQQHMTEGGEIASDESVFAFNSKKESKSKARQIHDPEPSGYFPRKPHKNGVYAFDYLFCFFRNVLKLIELFYFSKTSDTTMLPKLQTICLFVFHVPHICLEVEGRKMH